MDNEKLVSALQSLDTTNDMHWTSDGQPRLDAVNELMGQPVTRDAVAKAIPGFTRKNSNPAIREPNSSGLGGNGVNPNDAVGSPNGENLENGNSNANEGEKDEAQQKVDEAKSKSIAAKKELQTAVDELDEVITKESSGDNTTTVSDIQAYQKSQLKARAARTDKLSEIADLLK